MRSVDEVAGLIAEAGTGRMFEIGSAIGLVNPSPGSALSAVPDAAIDALKNRERKGVVKPCLLFWR